MDEITSYKTVTCKFLDNNHGIKRCKRYSPSNDCEIFSGDGVKISTHGCEKIRVDWIAYIVNKSYIIDIEVKND